MDPTVVRALAQRFEALMAEKRRNRQSRTAAQQTPPSAAQTDTTGPTPTQQQRQQVNHNQDPLYREVMSLSFKPQSYLRPGLLDKALDTLDLGKIYTWAEEYAAECPELGHQDCVIKGLLKLFKSGGFFTWVNAPQCSRCGGETQMRGVEQPSVEERRRGAGRTEVYQCRTCGVGAVERFPRYDDAEMLLETRKGRCGEWANCFTLCCLALGSRARWVWNAEDHVWTEVYSETLKRWIHCDSCE